MCVMEDGKNHSRKYLMASSRHINLINNGVDSAKTALTCAEDVAEAFSTLCCLRLDEQQNKPAINIPL